MHFLKILEVELMILWKVVMSFWKILRFSQRKMIFLDWFKKIKDHFKIIKNRGMKPDLLGDYFRFFPW